MKKSKNAENITKTFCDCLSGAGNALSSYGPEFAHSKGVIRTNESGGSMVIFPEGRLRQNRGKCGTAAPGCALRVRANRRGGLLYISLDDGRLVYQFY